MRSYRYLTFALTEQPITALSRSRGCTCSCLARLAQRNRASRPDFRCIVVRIPEIGDYAL